MIAAIALLLSGSNGSSSAPRPRALVPLLAFVGIGLTSALLGADPEPGVTWTTRILAWIALFLVLMNHQTPLASARTAIASLLLAVIGVATLGVYGQLVLARELAVLDIDVWRTELSLFARHPNLLAPWFGAAAGAGVALGVGRPPRRRRRGRAGRRRTDVDRARRVPARDRTHVPHRIALDDRAVVIVVVILPWLLRLRVERAAASKLALSVLVLVAAFFAFPWCFARRSCPRTSAIGWPRTTASITCPSPGRRRSTARCVPGRGRSRGSVRARSPHRRGSMVRRPRITRTTYSWPCSRAWGRSGLLAFLGLLGSAALLASGLRRVDGPEHRLAQHRRVGALLVQLLTSTLDAGDALDTLVPSRLFLDLALLAALARSAGLRGGLLPIHRYAAAGLGAVLTALALFTSAPFCCWTPPARRSASTATTKPPSGSTLSSTCGRSIRAYA